MNLKHKQAGGTLLGMIIGLIIGLGIAVAVAVTITKTPVPFIDRGMKSDKGVIAAASQLPDLNKSLYGNREPAKQAAREFQREPDATLSATPETEANKPDAKAETLAAESKPLPGKEVVKSEAAEARWSYYLQAGAFREQADAENAKAKLALMGIETRISERTSDTGTLYRVRVGPFSQVDAMNKVRTKLSENGVDVAVVRLPG